ncbi:hypothetical protein CB0940_06823 [Cercospora beticola]|uniref:Zn(2)-C6 fungal-type domain-containing protein n=1 Tax=Cercospora beticola TaxID=122368 RepID=A0A2G5H9U7_CERBT|nr:hypothetical protein CB0940_06823 [Cercospora beticola]PIA89063.1 hypothetical protein CB0940_06823 [Cercospora beticola]WPB02738.1 hypothetical protein RHO25_007374 [Cercospora beticola]
MSTSIANRDGCEACRLENIYCDKTRPECKNCVGRGIECPGTPLPIRLRAVGAPVPQAPRDHVPLYGTRSGDSSPREGSNRSSFELARRRQQHGVETFMPSEQLESGLEDSVRLPSRSPRSPDSASVSSVCPSEAVDAHERTWTPGTEQSFTTESADATGETAKEHSKHYAADPDLRFMDQDIISPAVAAQSTTRRTRTSSLQEQQILALQQQQSSLRTDNMWLADDTRHTLTAYYINQVPRLMSCFDSPENPFRGEIPQLVLTSELLMARHETSAIRGITSVIRAIRSIVNGVSGNDESPFSTRLARKQALLAAFLLVITTSWCDASATNHIHLHGAKPLFRAWMADQRINEFDERPLLLNREQSFIIGAMGFMEYLKSIVVDQDFSSVAHLRRFTKVADGQPIYLCPWTGFSTPLFIYLTETMIIVRRKRRAVLLSRSKTSPASTAGADEDLSRAREIYEKALNHMAPPAISVPDTQDPTTPIDHLFAVDTIMQLTILLELTLAFPQIAMEYYPSLQKASDLTLEARRMALDFAISVLSVVPGIPQDSGCNNLIPIQLISVGSALQASAARSSQTADLQTWRNLVVRRMNWIHERHGVPTVLRMIQVLETVWLRADELDSTRTDSSGPTIHWMDIMIGDMPEELYG